LGLGSELGSELEMPVVRSAWVRNVWKPNSQYPRQVLNHSVYLNRSS